MENNDFTIRMGLGKSKKLKLLCFEIFVVITCLQIYQDNAFNQKVMVNQAFIRRKMHV